MKKEDTALLATLMVCLAVALMGLKSVPSTDQYPTSQSGYPTAETENNQAIGLPIATTPHAAHSTNEANRGNNQPNQNDWGVIKRRLPDSTALQTLFDFALVVIGYLQYLIYRNMRRDSIAKDRACVFVSQIKHTILTVPHDQRTWGWRFNHVFQNAGTMIAEKAVAQVSGYAGSEITDQFHFPDHGEEGRNSGFIIGPKSIAEGGGVEFPIPILVAAQKRILRSYIWGWVEYKDSFNPRFIHRFEFCNEILVHGDARQFDCGFSYPYRTNHNGEDDDCRRKPKERGPLENFQWPILEIKPGEYEEYGLPEPPQKPDFFSDQGTSPA